MSSKKLSSIVIRTTVVLLCLVLFSSHLASGMFARYTVSADQHGTASVAKYGVKVISSQSGDPLDNADVNGNVNYVFKVDNSTSEVAVIITKIKVVISDVNDLHNGVKLNGFDASEKISESESVTYVFDQALFLSPGSTSDEFSLSFNIASSWKETTDNTLAADTITVNNTNYPVSILVDAEQVN